MILYQWELVASLFLFLVTVNVGCAGGSLCCEVFLLVLYYTGAFDSGGAWVDEARQIERAPAPVLVPA